MAILGDILAAARDSSSAFHGWLAAADPELAGRVRSVAHAAGVTPTGYVRMAIADFSRFAPEEDWATLTSNLRDSGDPGTTCLLAMVHWRLTAEACGEHCAANDREGEAHGGAA